MNADHKSNYRTMGFPQVLRYLIPRRHKNLIFVTIRAIENQSLKVMSLVTFLVETFKEGKTQPFSFFIDKSLRRRVKAGQYWEGDV